MKLQIEIETDNAAFADGQAGAECARILRELADRVADWPGANAFTVGARDINGNRVGSMTASQGSAK